MGFFPASSRQGKNRGWSIVKTQTVPANQSVKSIVSPWQEVPAKAQSNLVPEISGKYEEKSRGTGHKKVRFDSNIIVYDPVSPVEDEQEDIVEDQNAYKVDNQGILLTKDGESWNKGSFIAAIAGSYLPNCRYENCRDSDDEYDYWGESGESDPEDEVEYSSDFYDDDGDRDGEVTAHTDEINQMSYSPNPAGRKTRSRIPPVLRPIENLAQWNAVKAEGVRSCIPAARRPVENLAQWIAVKGEDAHSCIPPVRRPVENLAQLVSPQNASNGAKSKHNVFL